jgi:hypothetical protein
MSNNVKHRNRKQFTYSVRPGLTKLQGSITLGVAGAVSSNDVRGLESVTRTGTGKYRLVFDDDWLGLNAFSFAFEQATTDGYNVLVLDSSKIASDKYVDVQVVNASNAAADPISTVMFLEFSLKTSERG